MRRAFRWVYQELDSGRNRRSILRRAGKSDAPVVKASFQHLDQSAKFDLQNQPSSRSIIGLDEVGRGPLAGPLVAVCVQLPYPTIPSLPFLRDSKKLQADEREFLAKRLEQVALRVGYGVVEASEFGGDLNLHQLTFLAMTRALQAFRRQGKNSFLLVDGKFRVPQWPFDQLAVVKGDDKSLSIAAASVLAKTYRDKIMKELDESYPQYGFAKHVGYGTLAHRKALLLNGPCPQHRSNFLSKILGLGHTGSS